MIDFLCQIKILVLNILKMFLNKEIVMMTKKFYLYDRFFVSNQDFTTKHIKNVKNSRFFV